MFLFLGELIIPEPVKPSGTPPTPPAHKYVLDENGNRIKDENGNFVYYDGN